MAMFMKAQMMIRAALATAGVVMSASLAAADSLTIESDKTQMISLSVRPGVVVVGNPSIADVSINGTQVFVHGRGFGNTNIIVLDVQGAQIASFDITVKQSTSNAVSLYRGGIAQRYSYACDPVCENTLQVGDNPDWFKAIAEAQAGKSELATGSETSEANAPPAPQ
jgi:hypothetical protein